MAATRARSASIYTPLHRGRKEIRLLEIVSVEPEITFKTHVVSLLDEPVFTALSYVWGYPPTWVEVIVDGAKVPVTENLINAVKDIHTLWAQQHPKRTLESTRLWADAICINQQDVVEKGFQVPLMREIYSGAEQVLSWLGKADEVTKSAFDTLQRIHSGISALENDDPTDLGWMKSHHGLCNGYETDPRGPWLDIIDLMHRPYWSRVWIFQEVYLARSLLFMSGQSVLDFNCLKSIQEWHESAILGQPSRPTYINPGTWAYLQNHRGIFESISAIDQAKDIISDGQRHQSRIRGILRDTVSDDAIIFYNQVETHALLLWIMAGVLESTDPKDSIYALLGVSGLTIEPDYTAEKPPAEVYLDFLRLWQDCCSMLHPYYPNDAKSGILDLWFLIFAGVDSENNAKPVPGLPSWAPNFPAIASRYESGWSYSTSSLSQFPVGEELFTHVSEQWHIDGMKLCCPAVWIDEVAHTGPVVDVVNQDIIRWALDSLSRQLKYPTGYDSAIAMHRVLVGQYFDEDLENMILPTLEEAFGLICLFLVQALRSRPHTHEDQEWLTSMDTLIHSLLLSLGRQEHRDTFWEGLHNRAKDNDSPVPPNVADLLDTEALEATRHQLLLAVSTSGGDRVAQTKKGYFGRFPAYVRGGDVICLLKGYDGPVVLRRVGNDFIFVGSAFIVEALGGRTEVEMEIMKSSIEMFEIC